MINYKKMLKSIDTRLFVIEQSALTDEKLNREWNDLTLIQNILYRLLKETA